MSNQNENGLFTFLQHPPAAGTEVTPDRIVYHGPTPDMLEEALAPLTKLKIEPHPLHGGDDNAWVFYASAAGPVAGRRWVLANQVVLDLFPIGDVVGQTYVRQPEPWYGDGWERGILVKGLTELRACLDPLRVFLIREGEMEYRRAALTKRWGDQALVNLASALLMVDDRDWVIYHRRAVESPQIKAARAAYKQACVAVGRNKADACWEAYDHDLPGPRTVHS